MHKTKITDDQLVHEYTVNKIGIRLIARKYNMRMYAIEKRINRLAEQGLVVKNKPNSKKTDKLQCNATHDYDRSLGKKILDDYKSGLGIKALAVKYGINKGKIRYHLIKINIYDPKRACISNGDGYSGPQRSRDRRRGKDFEFSYKTKKEAYDEWSGGCVWCGERLPKFSTGGISYHHIEKMSEGGCNNIDNCAPMHRHCHEDDMAFKMLHGFDKIYLYKTNKEKKIIANNAQKGI